MTYRGQVKNGVVVLPEGVTLREGSTVRVEPVEETTPALSLAERLGEWAGKGVGLPEDLARNHDHYLHGQPRR
jgi:hypothetical protein